MYMYYSGMGSISFDRYLYYRALVNDGYLYYRALVNDGYLYPGGVVSLIDVQCNHSPSPREGWNYCIRTVIIMKDMMRTPGGSHQAYVQVYTTLTCC